MSDQASNHGVSAPLDGIRVVDLTSVIMGPLATQIFADLGADVICIEPLMGDPVRTMGSGPHAELSGIAMNLLRNKRNLAMDLGSPEGRRALGTLLATCDVFVSNLRTSSLERLGLTYADVRQLQPGIVWCRMNGFPDGERASDPAYDDVIQAGSGLADVMGRVYGSPRIVPSVIADKVCGMAVAHAVTAALLFRERTGEGQPIELSMMDVMRSFVLVEHGAGAISVHSESRSGYTRLLTPCRRPQQTSDGWIMILPYTQKQYASFFEEAGLLDAVPANDYETATARISNAEALFAAIERVAPTRSTTEWISACRRIDVSVSTVEDLDDLVAALPVEEHPIAGGYHRIPPLIPIGTSRARISRHAPLVGQHSEEILVEAGVPAGQVRRLIDAGVVQTARVCD